MATRRRKKTARYAELLPIGYKDLVVIGVRFVELAKLRPPRLGVRAFDTRDARGADPKMHVDPAWALNVAVVYRLAEVAADGEETNRRKIRTEFIRAVGLWDGKTPPAAGTIKRYRDLWPDPDRIDDVILRAWDELRKTGHFAPTIVLFP